ncbi:CLUMA_CG013163, isoform A [Clunio marinus]|uniref:CLUMA_CG013163, isoform A n=1 Tax=Clunio marinus TaxID=568069 RepID=A0A1J1IJZ0_9DIPT|nr:CLUMA_CG013163, isoform A [Clunio marinus]
MTEDFTYYVLLALTLLPVYFTFRMVPEKVLNIFPIENGSFRLIKSKTEDEKTEYWRSNVEWKKTGDFLCFGATVLLIRHLTRELFEGCIHSWDCDMEGNFAIVIQTFRKIQIAVISDQKVETQQVDLKIIPFNEQVFTSASFHLAGNGNGRIINSMSCSSPLIFHPHSLFNKSGSQRNISDDWEKDLQLVSMYLDFKTEEKNKKHEKCEDSQNSHPEVTLQDYIQCLIKSKPQNVMNFTVDFVRKLEHDGNVLAYQTTPHRHQQI